MELLSVEHVINQGFAHGGGIGVLLAPGGHCNLRVCGTDVCDHRVNVRIGVVGLEVYVVIHNSGLGGKRPGW